MACTCKYCAHLRYSRNKNLTTIGNSALPALTVGIRCTNENILHLSVRYPSPFQVGVNVIETLLPYQSCAYSWDEPLGERALVVMKLAAGGGGGPRTKSRRGRRGEAIAAANAGRGEGRRAASRFGGVSGKKALRTLVGVYGLDLMKPYTVVGTLRIGAAPDRCQTCSVFLLCAASLVSRPLPSI